jgi:phosphoribosylformylglycinamidine synthase subunit PurS
VSKYFKFIVATFIVHVTIENKPGISDPEGDTILNDLVLKGSRNAVSKIKTAKMLKFTIQEKDKKTAQVKVQEICDDLRIYNPMVSKITIDVLD